MDIRLADLEFPGDLHYLIEHQVWARFAPDGSATVGITSLGIALAGEIYMCRPKAPGTAVEQGHSIAVVELAKSIVSVKSPLSGKVIEINPRLAEVPEWIHRDPYGEGWLARIAPDPSHDGRAALIQGAAVAQAMAEHARLYRID